MLAVAPDTFYMPDMTLSFALWRKIVSSSVERVVGRNVGSIDSTSGWSLSKWSL